MGPEWFETLEDDIWLPPDEVGAEQAQFIKKALCLRKGQVVLDAPCGAGRIAVHLARAGCRVTGMDLRPQFVERARRRFQQARLPGRFLVSDLRKVVFPGEFHGIFNWFGSFGYFSESENAELVRRYAAALRKGGRLLIEQVNRESILRNFIAERVDGSIITRGYWDWNAQRLINRRIVNGVDDPRNMSSMRLYTPGHMRGLFQQAGLIVENIVDFPDGDRFSRSSRRMVTIGRKL